MKFSTIATMFVMAIPFVGCDIQEPVASTIDPDAVDALLDYYSYVQEEPSSTFVEMPRDTFNRYRDAIGYLESVNNYHAVSVRSFLGYFNIGRYQMTEANVRRMTADYLGHEMQPWEFLMSPIAQDLVFEFSTREAYAKYPTTNDVASIWLSGRPFSKAHHLGLIGSMSVERYTDIVAMYIRER